MRSRLLTVHLISFSAWALQRPISALRQLVQLPLCAAPLWESHAS